MKEAVARLKYARISPQKVRRAADLVRGKGVEEAIDQLLFCKLKGGALLAKVIHSAVASAQTLFGVQKRELRVKEVYIDVGPSLKRVKSRSRGKRDQILKRTSHCTVKVGV